MVPLAVAMLVQSLQGTEQLIQASGMVHFVASSQIVQIYFAVASAVLVAAVLVGLSVYQIQPIKTGHMC